jgi:hypothetical protein
MNSTGFDIVKMIVETEEEFRLTIPDREAEQVTATVGKLADYVWARVALKREIACITAHTFYDLRRELLKLLPLGRRTVRPMCSLAELVPTVERRRVWRAMRSAGLPLPLLLPEPHLMIMAVGLVVALSLSLTIWFSDCFLLLPLVLALPLGVVMYPFRNYLSPRITIRDAVWRLQREHPTGDCGASSRSEIVERLRHLASRCSGVPVELITEQTHFIRDLGPE